MRQYASTNHPPSQKDRDAINWNGAITAGFIPLAAFSDSDHFMHHQATKWLDSQPDKGCYFVRDACSYQGPGIVHMPAFSGDCCTIRPPQMKLEEVIPRK